MNKIEMDLQIENGQTAVRGEGVGGWVERVKGLSQKKKSPHRHRQQCCDYWWDGGGGQVEEGERGVNGDGRRFDFGW